MSDFPLLKVNRTAEGAISPHRIVAAGSGELLDKQATADSDALLGVCGQIGATDGGRVDVIVAGIASVEYGGDVSRGDPLTSDALGRAIVATTTDQRVVGFAWEDGDVDTIGSMIVVPGLFQTSTITLAAASVTLEDTGGLYTAADVEAALAEVKTIADAPPAGSVTVADTGEVFTATDVEGVLAELEARVAALEGT